MYFRRKIIHRNAFIHTDKNYKLVQNIKPIKWIFKEIMSAAKKKA